MAEAAENTQLLSCGAQKKIHVFVTSYCKDFSKERDVVKEVFSDLRAWCEGRNLQLTECDFQWGNFVSKREQEAVLKDIQDCYFRGTKPYFLNISSDGLGWVPQCGHVPKETVKQYCKSLHITSLEQEIIHGAYRDDNEHALFLRRGDAFFEDLPEEDISAFPSTACVQSVKQDGVPNVQESRVIPYSYVLGNDAVFSLDSNFADKVSEFLKSSIMKEFPLCTDSASDMASSQHAFVKCRSGSVIGQETTIEQIIEYIETGDKDVPLVILGGPGSGKSSLLCKAVDVVLNKLKQKSLTGSGNADWQMFYHFVGAVPGSTDLETTLKRLLKEMNVVTESDMPKDVQAACQSCCSALSNQQTPPTIIFVDSLNQFPEDLHATVLSWLPRKLAPQVRCILSMIDNTAPHRTLISRESKPQELYTRPLDMSCRKALVKETLGKYHKILRSRQVDRLLSKTSSCLPLWLTVACEQIHMLDDFHMVDDKIDSFPDDLLDLLEYVLEEFERKKCGELVVASLCLLEASCAGLLESELLTIIGHDVNLLPPSPFDEKDEKESSEKEKKLGCLPSEKWSQVYRLLRPFLRPYGDSHEGRFDFYHRAMSKAVRRRYFFSEKDEESDLRQAAHMWWHTKLADYFESVTNIDRHVEEYPYQLSVINNSARLSRCLCNWSVIDKLYNEEFSSQLLKYWRKAGGADVMARCYINILGDLEVGGATEEEITRRHEQVARLFLQAGKYAESLELARTALKMEEQDLGGRNERLAELYGLVADIYDERLKLHDFVSATQLPDLERSMHYSRKSIGIRKSLSGEHHKFKLGMALMRMSFNMESWQSLTQDESILVMGHEAIDTAIQIFSELNDRGHYAEALMTKGVLAPRGSVEQLKLYNEAMDISQQIYGENHLLTSRLYINIGITHEDNQNYNKAYQYFKKWAEISEIVLGPDHPKTLRAKGVLKETRYLQIGRSVGDVSDENAGGDDEPEDNSEPGDNREVIGEDSEEEMFAEDMGWDLHNQGIEVALQNLLIQGGFHSGGLPDNQDVESENNGSDVEDSFDHVEDFEGQFVTNRDVENDNQSNDDIEDALHDYLEIEEHLDGVENDVLLSAGMFNIRHTISAGSNEQGNRGNESDNRGVESNIAGSESDNRGSESDNRGSESDNRGSGSDNRGSESDNRGSGSDNRGNDSENMVNGSDATGRTSGEQSDIDSNILEESQGVGSPTTVDSHSPRTGHV